MWRLLLQAGMGFATFDIGRRVARLKRLAVFLAVAGVVALLGLGALTAAAVLALVPRLGPEGAAAAVGAGLIALAGLIGWVGSWTPRQRRPATLVDRMRAEVGAAGSAIAETRASARRSARSGATRLRAAAASADIDDVVSEAPPAPGSRRKRALNMVLIATLAGVVLGRKL